MTFANSIGRAIGSTAAYTVHAAAVSVKATGKFGTGVVNGTADGYADHSTRLAAQRKLAYGAAGKPKSIAIAVKAEPVPASVILRA